MVPSPEPNVRLLPSKVALDLEVAIGLSRHCINCHHFSFLPSNVTHGICILKNAYLPNSHSCDSFWSRVR